MTRLSLHAEKGATLNRAILSDRDGIINEMIYQSDPGIVDQPYSPSKFELVPDIGAALRTMKDAGYKLVVVSNQPGVAKKHYSMTTFKNIQAKMHRLLAAEGVKFDAEYYCFHHPQAKIAKFRVACECRKPKPGMLLQAAKDLDLDLPNSFMIGDGLYDVRAGKAAGCKTILVANLSALLSQKMDETGAHPDYIARNVAEAAAIVSGHTSRFHS